MHRNPCWDEETHENYTGNVILVLVKGNRIGHNVRQIDLATVFFNVRMFARQKPADMGEKETAFNIDRIGVGFRIFVVNTMIASPFIDRILV